MTGVILFDLDGTLVDADHLHYEAWRQTLAPHGVDAQRRAPTAPRSWAFPTT